MTRFRHDLILRMIKLLDAVYSGSVVKTKI